jgi:geranylgeranyl pyrophosphate synthase
LPLIYTLPSIEEAEIQRLEDLFKNQKAEEGDYRRLIKLVRNNGVVDRIRSEAQVYVDKAARFLDPFPTSSVKGNLIDLNNYIVKRSF